MICRQLHSFALFRSKRYLTEQYGEAFFHEFKRQSTRFLHLPTVPDIGKSAFSSSYEFGPPYIAWLKTLESLGVSDPEIEKIIWKMNELTITAIPLPLRKLCGNGKYIS